jgi:hypothetical protein
MDSIGAGFLEQRLMQTVVHVTHEAIQKIGGIGAVLQGLLTSKTYLEFVPRNILIGPFWPADESGERRLGPDGEVLHSSLDSLYRSPLAPRFREIEQEFGVRIVYGRRRFTDRESGVISMPEVLLIDIAQYDAAKIAAFKYVLWEKFGIESARHEHTWDFEQYVRLAQPAVAALHALGATSFVEPCIILAHEYMGLPTALAAILERPQSNFRTIFYAHEVATVRRIVESHAGHDTMFYNVMQSAMGEGLYVEDVFGDQGDFYKHALVKTAYRCDAIFAVGDETLQEARFLGKEFDAVEAQVAYNGVPCWKITLEEKMTSRRKLQNYCQALLEFTPDYVFTHVTRLVLSKAMWRDLRVLDHLELLFREKNQTAVLFALSTEVPARRPEDILRMEQLHHWPVAHREGLPDLSGGEAAYYQDVQEFNARSRNIKVIFINQFGFERKLCGSRMPADMEFMDIRKGSDVEFGQSMYEPFGIAQVEPISFGGICVYTNVCGCAGFVEKAAGGATPNAIVADYTQLPPGHLTPEELLAIGEPQRAGIESTVGKQVAVELMKRLPRTPADFQSSADRGHALAEKMSWNAVAREYVVPGLKRVAQRSYRKEDEFSHAS